MQAVFSGQKNQKQIVFFNTLKTPCFWLLHCALAQPSLLNPTNLYLHKDGGAKRDRTADLLRAKQALSQLSYSPFTYPSRFGSSEASEEEAYCNMRRLT